MLTKLNERELDGILAALRFWQRTGQDPKTGMIPEPEREIATEHGACLSMVEINALCERLNTTPEPRIAVVLEGGIVQDIITDRDDLRGLNVYIIDYDTEGVDEDRIGFVKEGHREDEEAVIGRQTVSDAWVNLDEVVAQHDDAPWHCDFQHSPTHDDRWALENIDTGYKREVEYARGCKIAGYLNRRWFRQWRAAQEGGRAPA